MCILWIHGARNINIRLGFCSVSSYCPTKCVLSLKRCFAREKCVWGRKCQFWPKIVFCHKNPLFCENGDFIGFRAPYASKIHFTLGQVLNHSAWEVGCTPANVVRGMQMRSGKLAVRPGKLPVRQQNVVPGMQLRSGKLAVRPGKLPVR